MIRLSYGQLRGVESALPSALTKLFGTSFGFNVDRKFFDLRDMVIKHQKEIQTAVKKAIEMIDAEFPKPERNGHTDEEFATMLIEHRNDRIRRGEELLNEIDECVFEIGHKPVEITEEEFCVFEKREKKKEEIKPGTGILFSVNELAELVNGGIISIISKTDND